MPINGDFYHGIEVSEQDIGFRAVQVVTSSVGWFAGTAPDADPALFPENKNVLIYTRSDAVGLSRGTLASIAVNDGGADYTEATVAITGGGGSGATATAGIVDGAIDSITLTNPGSGYTSAPTVTITGDGDGATATASRTPQGTLPRAVADAFAATADQVSPLIIVLRVAEGATEADTLSNLVGGVDAGTGAYEGVQAVLAAPSDVHLDPMILAAPGWTHQRPNGEPNPVLAELVTLANRLWAVVYADGPNTNDADAITARQDFESARLRLIDPWRRAWDTATSAYVDVPPSALAVGMRSVLDQ
ncbi:MAG: hypothetical protein H6931_17720, partial [Burkholderiaceae bacterium]|nr:hypothetical protein [Burkholderiaceae bacterium]